MRSCWGRVDPKSGVTAVLPRRREETHRESRRGKTKGEAGGTGPQATARDMLISDVGPPEP